MGSRVLLLEADLRRPTIAAQLDVASGPGVADVLIGAELRLSLGGEVALVDDLLDFLEPALRRGNLLG